MAKSKKHQRNKQRRPAFYEAVPMTFTPPAALPGARENLSENLQIVTKWWKQFEDRLAQMNWSPEQLALIGYQSYLVTRRAASRLYKLTMWAGLATTNATIYAGRTGLQSLRYAASITADYAPPIAIDFREYLRRVARVMGSRRARSLYLAVAAGGAMVLVVVVAVTAAATINAYANDISSPAALLAKKKTGTTILDRNGQVLFEGYGGQDTKVIALGDLPKSLKDATLAAEDPSFYSNPGFSLKATARAAVVDFTHQAAAEGGSTITQQLVKNALLTSSKDFTRKYQELLLSMELTRRYSKDQILDMYLNEIYYGQGSSGVEAASQTYFHKSSRDLTLGESALIAGLPLGPSRFDPNYDISAATQRRNFVLDRMQQLGDITKAQAKAAENEPIQLAAAGAPQTVAPGQQAMVVYSKDITIKAPWFVFYVLDELRAQYGDDVVEQGGITVQTTLDLTKEEEAEQSVTSHINALADHHVTNGGLISLAPKTGDILAMVGSTDYNAPGFGNVNVTLSDLQPGSSFKPIAYATAFKKGWNGATTVVDAPFEAPNGDGTMYIPQNYDLKFHGTVTLRHALDNSLNIPAIKVLQFAGIPDTLQTAHDMGITTLNDPSRYGLSLVLGGGEVRPIDMATAYGTLDNNGVKVEPRSILKVTDRHGKDITKQADPAPQPVLDPRIAYMLTNILSDNPARLPEFPVNGPLQLDRPAAAKTGTTNDFRDNWTIGYTPQLVTAVWVGNNDHTPMNNVDGITGAAPIWHDYMEAASTGMPVEDFVQPAGITVAKVCSDGGLANPWDASTDEVFMTGSLPTRQCNTHQPFADTPATPSPNPSDTPPVVPPDQPAPSDQPTPPIFPPGRGGGGGGGGGGPVPLGN